MSHALNHLYIEYSIWSPLKKDNSMNEIWICSISVWPCSFHYHQIRVLWLSLNAAYGVACCKYPFMAECQHKSLPDFYLCIWLMKVPCITISQHSPDEEHIERPAWHCIMIQHLMVLHIYYLKQFQNSIPYTVKSLRYNMHQITKFKWISIRLAIVFCAVHWSREWRWSWSSANRRCSNYIWVINKFICLLECGLY